LGIPAVGEGHQADRKG